MKSINRLPPYDSETHDLNVIIETPRGERNKFKFDPARGLFKLSKVLPAGAVFPFDFGFVPSTLGGDGDPLDVLVLMDQAAFAGCLVPARWIGVIKAKQTERGKTEENDRLIAVAVESNGHRAVKKLDQLDANVIREIEHFFISYHEFRGITFTPTGHAGPRRAHKIIEEAAEQFRAPDGSGNRARKKRKRKGPRRK